jgi:glycosyltransferase involved in cell wall biosynthesis
MEVCNGNKDLKQIVIDELDHSIVFGAKSSELAARKANDLDLTLFVACYNEEKNIIDTIDTIVSAMSGLDLSWEVIVIDDASIDNSVNVLKDYMSLFPEHPIILVVREQNQGLAQNFIEAAFLGRGKYFRLINGDNVESSNQIATILGHIGEADILIPYHAQVQGRTIFRRSLSKMFTLIVNLLSGYRIKYYNACSVHLRHDVMRWHVNCSGFDFQANLITKLLGRGRTYIEIAAVGSERPFGQSKALTLRNFFSATRFFMDLAFSRIWNTFHGR